MSRAEFAKRLQSTVIPEGTSQEVIFKTMLPVSKVIVDMMPSGLFRYRPLYNRQDAYSKDLNNKQISAFENDTIFAVTADKFNDPYDTLVRFDQESIERSVNMIVSCDTPKEMQRWFAQGNDIPDEVKKSS